ncbi:desulfoferrodoxin [Candidatus Saccharibacteria bacterium]|nr:desulfoferrodoxin [Candidatus Saccharibacteria bacterium]
MQAEQTGLKFYRCNTCGNLFMVMDDSGVVPQCCGTDMELLAPHYGRDGAEKHIPVIERGADGVTVKVGSTPHPMTAEHHIEWIILTNGRWVQVQKLDATAAPEAHFAVTDATAELRAYAFCNLHGLWVSEK